MKKWISFLIVFYIVFALIPGVRVYSKDLDVKIGTNFGDPLNNEGWNRVEVEITNKGDKDFTGSVSVNYGSSVIQNVFVEKGKKVTVDFVIPPGFIHNFYNDITVEIRDGRDNVVQSEKVPVFWQGKVFQVGIIGPRVERYNLLKAMGYEQLISMKPEYFNNFLPLQNLSLIIIEDLTNFNLTGEGRENLKLWVNRGGTLVVGGEGLKIDYLPYKSSGSTVKNITLFDTEGEVLFINGEVMGDLLLEVDDTPLLVKKSLGKGTVIFSTIPFSDDIFTSPQFFTGFWNYILPNVSEKALNSNVARLGVFRELQYIFTSGESNLTFIKPGLLALGLVIYILVIGPLNFFLLRKWKKWDFGWLTVPLVAIFFTTTLFLVGSTGRSKEIVDTQINLVEYLGKDQAFVDSFTSIFLPSAREKKVEVEDKITVTPLTGGISLVDNKYLDLSKGRIWSNQRIHVTRFLETSLPKVSVDIYWNKREVIVKNPLEGDFFASFIQIGGEWFPLGEIKGGEEKSFTLTGKGTRNIDYNFLFQRFNTVNRGMFMTPVENLAGNTVTFVAFEDSSKIINIPQSKVSKPLNIHVVNEDLISVQYKDITGVKNILGEVTKVNAKTHSRWGDSYFIEGKGEVFVVFTLPSGLDYSNTNLNLSLDFYYRGNIDLEVLDKNGNWQRVNFTTSINLDNTEDYLLGNKVNIKVISHENNNMEINPTSFRLSVTGGGN
ncbi:hypothetical protein SAMN02745227_00440 [Anaerobranca californiensis DSM 14826]|jgi:hypothetical protein|uniref:Uncharacterized protein n=1 Tax=Anaerobranca californiensis DSM 14826 TaxID=1120989 RepID=A0A1M6LAQ7_9FIRM|nr:hypothetical protein [Anaerobranca californiensis]SHJ68291.1 hypothetical protein SAMN02745227_00440 [Anaerobranca californiensis DSM 14826]